TVVLNPGRRYIPGAFAAPYVHTYCHYIRIRNLRSFVINYFDNLVVTRYLACTPVNNRPLTQQLVAAYITSITVRLAQLKSCVLVNHVDLETLSARRTTGAIPFYDLVWPPAATVRTEVRVLIPVYVVRGWVTRILTALQIVPAKAVHRNTLTCAV